MTQLIELTCPNCGAKLETDRSAAQVQCGHCGTELAIERKGMAVAPNVGPEKCPKCGRVDRVQKVSSVHKEGSRTGWGEGDVWYSSKTELSKALSPPARPLMGPERGVLEDCGTFCMMGIGAVVSVGLLLVGLAVPGFWTMIGVGFSLLTVVAFLRTYTKLLGPGPIQQRSAKWERWENAVARWDRLYYCGRDDGVFIPDETPLIPMEKLQEFLYAD